MGLTLLIVEDSRFSSEIIRMMAAASGARVRRADSINAAKRHLATFRPSVALVDIGLPDGDGIELVRLISEQKDREIPVVAMSGADPDQTAELARAAGANAFLEKPIGGLSLFQRTILETQCDRELAAAQNARFDSNLPELDHSFIEIDLENACDLLREGIQAGDTMELLYCARFMIGVAKQMECDTLFDLAGQMSKTISDGESGEKAATALLTGIEAQLGNLDVATG